MKKTMIRVAPVALMAATVLAGCTFEASTFFTVPPEDFEAEIAAGLAREIGSPVLPNIDCGDENLRVTEGLEFVCVLTVDGDSGSYNVDVTITSVEGSEYLFHYVVADERN